MVHFQGKREWNEHRCREVLGTARLGKVLLTRVSGEERKYSKKSCLKTSKVMKNVHLHPTHSPKSRQDAHRTLHKHAYSRHAGSQDKERSEQQEKRTRRAVHHPPMSPIHRTGGLVRYLPLLSRTFFELGIITNQHKMKLLRNVLVTMKWRWSVHDTRMHVFHMNYTYNL